MDGKRLKRIREDQNYRPEDMAKLLNVSLRTYQSYERNERDPSTITLANLALAFGVSADYLMGISDEPYIHSHNSVNNQKTVSQLQQEIITLINRLDSTQDFELLIEFAKFLLYRNNNLQT